MDLCDNEGAGKWTEKDRHGEGDWVEVENMKESCASISSSAMAAWVLGLLLVN